MTKKPKEIITMIVVDADGEIITAANGHVSSDNRELVKLVKRSVFLPWTVQLVSPFGRRIRPSLDPEDLIGITAALFSARPGRTRLLSAPPEVMDWFKEEHTRRRGSGVVNPKDFKHRDLEDIARELAASVVKKEKPEGK